MSLDPAATIDTDSALRIRGLRTNSELELTAPLAPPVTEIRDALLERVAAAKSYVYIEGFTFTDVQLVQTIRSRLASAPDLTVIVVLPDYCYGGPPTDKLERGESYWSRCAYLVMALPFAGSVELNNRSIVPAPFDTTAGSGPLEYAKARYVDASGFHVVEIGHVRRILSSQRRIHLCAPYRRSGGKLKPIYVHSKVAIVDDRAAFVGSANFNSRSLTSDGEFSVLLEGPAVAPRIRAPLFAHWGMTDAASWRAGLDAAAASTADGVVLLPLDTASMYDHSPNADAVWGYFYDVLTSQS